MQKKIRVLGVAPYETMLNTMIRVAEERKDIELVEARYGDLENGAEIVRAYDPDKYDVILSRGGTKLCIDRVTDKPVFEIPVSYPDLLNIFNLVRGYSGKIAILCYPNISDQIRRLRDILQFDYDIFNITSWNDLQSQIEQIQRDGYSLVIGDAISVSYAARCGLQSILLVSGTESIRAAFDDIAHVYSYFTGIQKENGYLKAYFSAGDSAILCMNLGGGTLFRLGSVTAAVEKTCRAILPLMKKSREYSLQKKASGHLILIRAVRLRHNNEDCCYFTISEIRLSSAHRTRYGGMDVYERSELLNSDAGRSVANLLAPTLNRHKDALRSSLPLLITGEIGSEKNAFARQVFLRCSAPEDVLYVVRCGELNRKLLWYLLSDIQSPLFSHHTFVLFENLQALSAPMLLMFLQDLHDFEHSLPSRLLFTFGIKPDDDLSGVHRILETLTCNEIPLAPLRQQPEDIHSQTLLFINELNRINGNTITGIEPEAIGLLEAYPWPYNLKGLQRVLKNAAENAHSAWITSADIRKILHQDAQAERQLQAKQRHETPQNLDLSRTLEEIETDIVSHVLNEENMNQTRAAKRLGVSRTTLWRILKK
jgi:DNA-binding protein Fis